MSVKRPLLIFGARIFSEEIADLASDIPDFEVAGFVENLDREHPRELRGLPVYWIDDVARLASTHVAVCALGTTQRIRYTQQAEAMGFSFISLIHPTARISRTAEIGPGAILGAGCLIASYTRIGAHTIVNRGAMLGHHSAIGHHSTLGPGANIAGVCSVGSQVWVGMGAVVLDRINIGDGSVIAAAAVVSKNIPARSLAAGHPARIVKTGIDPK